MVYAFSEISGVHFNPTVTIGYTFSKKIAWNQVPKYILAQAIGVIFVSFLLWFLFPDSRFLGEITPAENFPP